MPIITNVAGAALIRIDAGAGLEDLGYSLNGVEISDEPYYDDVKCDSHGGEAGPSADIQHHGFHSVIRIELSRWDSVVAAKLHAFLPGVTAGVRGTPGSLMSANSYRLLILSTNLPRNYPAAFVAEPQEINKGARYSRLALTFHAFGFNSSTTVWNTTTA